MNPLMRVENPNGRNPSTRREQGATPELAGSVPIAAPPSTLVDRRTVQIVEGAAGIEPCMPLLGRDLSVGELCRVGDYGDPARLARG